MRERTFHKVSGLRKGEIPPDNWKPTLYYVDNKNIITAVYTDADRIEMQEEKLEEYNRDNEQMLLFV